VGWRDKIRAVASPDHLGVFDPGGILSPTASIWWVVAMAVALFVLGVLASSRAGLMSQAPVTAVLAALLWASTSLVVAAETRSRGRAPIPWMLVSCLLSPLAVIAALLALHYFRR